MQKHALHLRSNIFSLDVERYPCSMQLSHAQVQRESVAIQKQWKFKTKCINILEENQTKDFCLIFKIHIFPLINIDHIYYYRLPKNHFIANIYVVFFGLVNDECLGKLPLTEEAAP